MMVEMLPFSTTRYLGLILMFIPYCLILGVLRIPAVAFAQAPPFELKDPMLISEGDKVFSTTCSIAYCHGKEGSAGRAPGVRDRKWEVAQLHKIIREGIPKTSMPNWDDKLSERQIWAVVAYILSLSAEADTKSSTGIVPSPSIPKNSTSSAAKAPETLPDSLVGNPARGEELFFDSSAEKGCAGCHSIGGKGNSVGPDLTGISQKTARDIFRDIVFPSARVDITQQALRITMRDGERILGFKQEETTAAIRVFDMGSIPPVLRRLAKDQIQTVEPYSESTMPSRYAETYTLRQLLDLVSFLKSSGAPAAVNVTIFDIQ